MSYFYFNIGSNTKWHSTFVLCSIWPEIRATSKIQGKDDQWPAIRTLELPKAIPFSVGLKPLMDAAEFKADVELQGKPDASCNSTLDEVKNNNLLEYFTILQLK